MPNPHHLRGSDAVIMQTLLVLLVGSTVVAFIAGLLWLVLTTIDNCRPPSPNTVAAARAKAGLSSLFVFSRLHLQDNGMYREESRPLVRALALDEAIAQANIETGSNAPVLLRLNLVLPDDTEEGDTNAVGRAATG
jgi:hypothetical protein